MYQRDFILRMIEDFFRFLSIVLKLKGNKEFDKALEMVDETALKLLKIDLNKLLQGDEQFDVLLTSNSMPIEQMELLAELLKVRAEIHIEINQIFSAITAYEKSFELYNYCQTHSKNYSLDRNKKMEEIIFALNNLRETHN